MELTQVSLSSGDLVSKRGSAGGGAGQYVAGARPAKEGEGKALESRQKKATDCQEAIPREKECGTS